MKSTDVKTSPAATGSRPLGSAGSVGKVGDGPDAKKSAPAPLRMPETTRAPLGERPSLEGTARRVHGQVQVRQERAHQGTRSKKLKEERLDALDEREMASFRTLSATLTGMLDDVRRQVGSLSDRAPADVHGAVDRALSSHREDFTAKARQAIRGKRSMLKRSGLDAMQASGADTLMVHVLLQGKLSMSMVRAEMARLTEGIRGGALSVADVKKGLVTADGLLQRFRLAGVPVDYSHVGNGPRDLLLSFASSLHR